MSVSAPETFEWVQHGDASARKRARAHVTRGFRRQKAEAALLAKNKTTAINKSASSSPDTVEDDEVVEENNSPSTQKKFVKSKDGSKKGSPSSQNNGHIEHAKPTMQDFILVKTIGPGLKVDPFNSLPVKLDANGHAILEHCE